MPRANAFVCLLMIFLAGCKLDTPTASPQEMKLSESVGHEVVLDGIFHSSGKFGVYITVDNTEVYLLARTQADLGQLNSFNQGLADQENKRTRFSGVLYLQKATASPNPLVSGIPEYYFMKYPGTKVTPLPP